jgi:hypothetical protein
MSNREEFKSWWEENGKSDTLCKGWAGEAWQARQPEIDGLKAENERLRKDAERYRWLVDQDLDDRIFIVRGTNGTWGECGHSGFGGLKDLIDEVIDEAMKEVD